MKRLLILLLCGLSLTGYAQKPSDTSVSQMEKLDRGLIVYPPTSGKCFVSWRLLGADDNNTTFEILKNGASLQKNIYKATSASVKGRLNIYPGEYGAKRHWLFNMS